VTETWLIPHQGAARATALPGDGGRTNRRSTSRQSREGHGYRSHEAFDGGQWWASRGSLAAEATGRYDESGKGMMHMQTALEDVDVSRAEPFDRCRAMLLVRPIAAMLRPLPGEPRFLTRRWVDEIGHDLAALNAFIPWEFKLVRDDRQRRSRVSDRTTRTRAVCRDHSLTLRLPVGDHRPRECRRSAPSPGRDAQSTRTRAD